MTPPLWSRLGAGVESATERLDRWQQRRAWTALPTAVVVRHRLDGGGRWAALLAHFGFLSLLPFLLLLVTALGFVLEGHPQWQRQVLDTAVTEIPVVGHQLRANVSSLGGSGPAVVVGIVGAWYGGSGVLRTAHDALDAISARPPGSGVGIYRLHLRVALVALTVVLLLFVAAAVGAVPVLSGSVPVWGRLLTWMVSLLLGTALLAVAFRWLASDVQGWRQLFPGAGVGALGWSGIHWLGGLYVDSVVRQATLTYGAFAVVIGLLTWLYLQARVFLLAAAVNRVLADRLWPVSFR